MSESTFVTAKQIVHELGLYSSVHAVYRAVKNEEIPRGERRGKRDVWLRAALIAAASEPAPKPQIIKRTRGGA